MLKFHGEGVLVVRGSATPVNYLLAESASLSDVVSEGTVFADPGSLRAAFDEGPCLLRLESGGEAKVVLLDLLEGAADFHVIGPIRPPPEPPADPGSGQSVSAT
jgi:hypothetical protein